MLKESSLRARLSEVAGILRTRTLPAVRFQLLVVAAFVIAAHWRLIANVSNCVVWSNYALPCTRDQYLAWVQWSPTLGPWLPLAGMGGPVTLPFSTELAQLTYWFPTAGLSEVVGPPQGAAWFAVLATLLLATTFVLWARTVVRTPWGVFAGLLLFIAGPFQLQLYGNGDYGLFVAESFVFLSICLLYRAIHEPSRRWLFYPASLVCLIVSFAQIQMLFVGFLLYASFLVFYVVPWGQGSLRTRLQKLGGLALRFLTLPLLLAPFLLPTLLSPPFQLGPASAYANPLLVYQHLSATPQSVFFMLGYLWTPGTSLTDYTGYAMVTSASSSTLATVWTSLTLALVVSVWAGVLIFRDRRGISLLGLALLASFFGSGTQGPLGPLNTYLYLHLPGYQELNASYFWDWMLVVPATALALGILVERIHGTAGARESVASERTPRLAPARGHRPRALFDTESTVRPRVRYWVAAGLGVLLATTIVLPYAVGAQYGPVEDGSVGIQTVAYPSDYSDIPASLSHLVGSSYAGVAVFDPSRAWSMYSSRTTTPNFFYYFPTARGPVIPSYNTPPVASNYYAYWAYEELYSNSSAYVGELLALSGIGYLLVFYGTEPIPSYLFHSYDGTNVSHLLEYQHGISRVMSSKDFAIYQDLYFASTAASLSGLSVVAGGDSELDAMAYAGLNLTQQGVIFASDLPPGGCGSYLARTSVVYTASANALEGLALACAARSSSDPVDSLTGDHTVSDGWTSSFASEGGALGEGIVEAWPSPLAVSHGGGHSTSVPVDVGSCRSCRLWLPVRFASDAGGLRFRWGADTWTVNTTRAWSGTNHSMIWVQLPFHPVGSGTLRVTSISGWNAIGTVYVAAPASVDDWLNNLTQTKPIAMAIPGGELAPPTATQPGQAINYCGLPTVQAIAQTSLCLQSLSGAAPISFNISLARGEAGWFSLLVRSTDFADLEIGSPPVQTIGIDTTNGKLSQYPMGWIRIPLQPSELSPNGTLTLTLQRGVIWISEVVFTPYSTYTAFAATPEPPSLSIGPVTRTSAVSGLNVSVSRSTDELQDLSGSVGFTSPGPGSYLATVSLNRTPPGEADVGIEYSVSPGLIVNFDGMRLAGNGSQGLSQFTSSMLSVPAQQDPSTSTLALFTTANTSTVVNASFSIRIEYGTMSLNSTLRNVDPSTNWTLTSNSNGYRLAGGPASMVLVRVPFYPNLAVSPSACSIAPAFGAVDSIIMGSTNITQFTVTTGAAAALVLGLEIMGGTIAVWMAAEFFWYRLRARRRGPDGPGPERSYPADEPPPAAATDTCPTESDRTGRNPPVDSNAERIDTAQSVPLDAPPT